MTSWFFTGAVQERQWGDEEAKGKMAIKMDDGAEWLIEVRGGGWIMECESGKKFRMTRLGCLRSLNAKKEKDRKSKKKEKVCPECGDEFPNEVALSKHLQGNRCKKMEDMSKAELRRRRVTRATAVAQRGEKVFDVEPVEVRSCSGEVAKPCGSFVYLGSLTNAKCSSGPEIRRRIVRARMAFGRVWRFWTMRGLSLKLKGRLYSAFVQSVLLYNCEVWCITKGEMEALEAKNVYLMRKVAKKAVQDEEDHLSGPQLLEMLGLESIESTIRKKQLQWVAHCARRGDGDLTWQRMQREVEDEESSWGAQVRREWRKLGVRSAQSWCDRVADQTWLSRKLKSR